MHAGQPGTRAFRSSDGRERERADEGEIELRERDQLPPAGGGRGPGPSQRRARDHLHQRLPDGPQQLRDEPPPHQPRHGQPAAAPAPPPQPHRAAAVLPPQAQLLLPPRPPLPPPAAPPHRRAQPSHGLPAPISTIDALSLTLWQQFAQLGMLCHCHSSEVTELVYIAGERGCSICEAIS